MKLLVFIHVLGAVLFIGNITTAAFWKIRAERSGDLALIRQTAKYVMAADYVFTLPGIVMLIGSGEAMMRKLGYTLTNAGWLSVALGLFAVTGVLWLAILLPAQRKMIRESERSQSEGALTPAYKRASRTWNAVGIAATLLPLVVLFLMVVKPG